MPSLVEIDEVGERSADVDRYSGWHSFSDSTLTFARAIHKDMILALVAVRSGLSDRAVSLQQSLANEGLDGYLATSDAAVFYLSGLRTSSFDRFVGILVSRSGPATLIVPGLELEAAREHAQVGTILVWNDGEDPIVTLATAVNSAGLSASRVGIEEHVLSFQRVNSIHAVMPQMRLVEAANLLARQRARKAPSEIASMRDASRMIARALERVFAEVREGMSELEIQGRLELALRLVGCEEQWSLVLGGPNSALPHGKAGTRPLRRGDVLSIDVMAMSGGYYSDVTRCATLGPASREQRRLWTIVAEAQAAGVEAARVGARAGDVDVAARAVTAVHGVDEAFVHRTGHGIGLEVAEPPSLFSGNDTVLEEGMVITVEPGVYYAGVGGFRLEDTVLVAADGPEVLTPLSRELLELEKGSRLGVAETPGPA